MADFTQTNNEFENRYSGKYLGIYKGQVSDMQDPAHACRLRCTFPQHFGNHVDTLDWAFPSPSVGGGPDNAGLIAIPAKGHYVWLQFVDGDISEPVWSYAPSPIKADGTSGIPKHAQGLPDVEDQGSKGTYDIPPSSFKGEYGKVHIWRTPGGNLIELDDTDGHERVQLHHKTGSHIEMLADGTVCEVAEGQRRILTHSDKKETTLGSETHTVQGSRTEEIHGNYKQTVHGDTDIVWLGKYAFKVQKYDLTTDGDQKFASGGSIYIASEANMTQSAGGSRATMVASADSQTVMGPWNVMVTNALNTNPLATSMLLHSLNGLATFKATDPTGLASGGYLEIGWSPALVKLFAGSPVNSLSQLAGVGSVMGSGLVLDGTGVGTVLHSMVNLILKAQALTQVLSPLVQLGMAAVHPGLWGEIAAISHDTHTHIWCGIPSSPPVGVPMATAVSQSVFIS